MFQESLRRDPVMPTMRKTFDMISGGNNAAFVISREIRWIGGQRVGKSAFLRDQNG